MRRRSSGALEDQETSSPSGMRAGPSTHDEEGLEKRKDTEKHIDSNTYKEERRKDGPSKQMLPGTARMPTITHGSSPPSSLNEDEDEDKDDEFTMHPPAKDITTDSMAECDETHSSQLRSHWACSLYTILTTILGFGLLALMVQSFMARQLDTKGCEMCYMRPAFAPMPEFDNEHTRFANKYSLYLYREGLIDEDVRVKGVPVIFIPGNAGSYKQVRSLASEAAYHYHNVIRHDVGATSTGKRPLDFFTVDFNEDFTAFHGQTLLDQAEYLNDAITFILSLYHTPSRSFRDSDLPDPTSVIIVGHSMGGVVARTMVTMPNYQSSSINTVITLSAPHARAPVSFDGDMVRIYKGVNDYWRRSYSQKWAIDNPLWHVTLISIAGGGLDTIVSSDYADIASLVPETHGFTVFTTSMPNVWTGADHLAITWCDQVRKSIVRALYDVIDVSRPTQTLPRAERMRGFKRWFLTGLEDIAEKNLPHSEPKTLLTLEDDSSAIMQQGEKLVLRNLGNLGKKPKPHLLPIPSPAEGKKFALLTNERLDLPGEQGKLEVLLCSVFSLQAGQSAALFSMKMDLSGESPGSTKLVCKNAVPDVIYLPASTSNSTFPFKTDQTPFSYLQYEPEDIADYSFVAVVDKSGENGAGWVVAEFTTSSDEHRMYIGLRRLLATGLSLKLPAHSDLVMDINIPTLRSSLLTYKLHVDKQACASGEIFAPLLRQFITNVYESKFFVNIKDADINLHGVAPYIPPPFLAKTISSGLSLQIWSDPTCDNGLEILLKIDIFGSMGKLWMRYRVVFVAFPILVVALVLRQQFRVYNETAIFMSFTEGLNQCLRSSLPFAFAALTFLSIALAQTHRQDTKSNERTLFNRGDNITNLFDSAKHELLLGSDDTSFWFLFPLFGATCVGICVVVNYLALGITYALALLYSSLRPLCLRSEEPRRTPSDFAVSSTRHRIITTCILLSLVSTVIPYHFAYVVLCAVQIATCVRGLRLARETHIDANFNFYNYAHSILILMIWILPINLPVLVVWVRNLTVHWLTPFSSHHNILAILPFILLVETISTGRMVPRVSSPIRLLNSCLLFATATYAAVYGVSYAYVLHYLANIFCAWLVAIHFDAFSLSVKRISSAFDTNELDKNLKRP